MRSTNQNNTSTILENVRPLLVDTKDLQMLLSCGYKTAVELGEQAKAKVYVGKRVLWNVNKMQAYLDAISLN